VVPIAIIGNAGSGKTFLANKICDRIKGTQHVPLDDIFWLPGNHEKKRPETKAIKLLKEETRSGSFVIEGVFSDLLAHASQPIHTLIWLTPPWPTCRDRLLLREQTRGSSAEQIDKFLDWASRYEQRTDPLSHSGHSAYFESFNGAKYQLASETGIQALLEKLSNNES